MKTVKVRIALEIGPEGDWHAYGYGAPGSKSEEFNSVMDSFDAIEDAARHWIEAEVPVPEAEPDTLHGKAVEVEETAKASEAA